MNSYSTDAQLERIRTMPPVVLWLTQGMGCWVLGSRASFSDVRIHDKSDWDILVPFEVWEQVTAALPIDGKRTKPGGWRFDTLTSDGASVVVDVFPGSLDAMLRKPYVHVAWHPKTATIVEVRR